MSWPAKRIRHFLLSINREGRVTIVLTTHDLADVERLCSRVLLIDRGVCSTMARWSSARPGTLPTGS